MKAYFDVHGSLTVEGEDATEWLALRTWSARWSDNAGPLIVVWKTERIRREPGDAKDFPMIETDSRQMFRTMSEKPKAENEALKPSKQPDYMPLMGTPLAIRFDALSAEQAVANHGQGLEQLRDRGGLDLSEAAAVKEKRGWRSTTAPAALCSLATHVLKWPKAAGSQ